MIRLPFQEKRYPGGNEQGYVWALRSLPHGAHRHFKRKWLFWGQHMRLTIDTRLENMCWMTLVANVHFGNHKPVARALELGLT